jgi:hypothetical protein
MRRPEVDHQLDGAVREQGLAEGAERALDLPILQHQPAQVAGGLGASQTPLTGRRGELELLNGTRHDEKLADDAPDKLIGPVPAYLSRCAAVESALSDRLPPSTPSGANDEQCLSSWRRVPEV